MLLVAGITIWLLGSGFLLFGVFGLPPFMRRASMTLLCAEVLALMVAHETQASSLAGETSRTLVSQDLPALAAVLYALGIGYAVRARRKDVAASQAFGQRNVSSG